MKKMIIAVCLSIALLGGVLLASMPQSTTNQIDSTSVSLEYEGSMRPVIS